MTRRHVLLLVATLLPGCSTPNPAARGAAATPAANALAKGDLGAAERGAASVLARDAENPKAALVRAIARYERTANQLSKDLRTVAVGSALAGGLNQRYLESALEQADADLAKVDADLALAARDPELSLDLCLACWEKDWNGNGRVDSRDRLLFQIEQDSNGQPIPEDDPRRKPTFRFDHGDVYWARAFVAFQRALIDVALGYDFGDLNRLFADDRERPRTLRLRLVRPERVKLAREQVLAGLRHSETSRKAYLAEKDDEREWVPNPRQKSHPLPLPMDATLYETWEGVVRDLERLMRSEEGLSVSELAQLGDHRWKDPPGGFIDLGSMFSAPHDIVIDLDVVEHLDRPRKKQETEAVLRGVLGSHYVRQMKPSPLLRRVGRMKGEVERGEESLERKLRYLLWIN